MNADPQTRYIGNTMSLTVLQRFWTVRNAGSNVGYSGYGTGTSVPSARIPGPMTGCSATPRGAHALWQHQQQQAGELEQQQQQAGRCGYPQTNQTRQQTPERKKNTKKSKEIFTKQLKKNLISLLLNHLLFIKINGFDSFLKKWVQLNSFKIINNSPYYAI